MSYRALPETVLDCIARDKRLLVEYRNGTDAAVQLIGSAPPEPPGSMSVRAMIMVIFRLSLGIVRSERAADLRGILILLRMRCAIMMRHVPTMVMPFIITMMMPIIPIVMMTGLLGALEQRRVLFT